MNVSGISFLEVTLGKSQMRKPHAENRDIRKMPKWAHHKLQGFQAQNEKKVTILLGAGKVLGGLPGCTLNCKITKGNVEADSLAA